MIKKILIIPIFLFFGIQAHSEINWTNNATDLFQSNSAIIYGINIRNFNAFDKNNDGIIEIEKGEERGNFINAVDRLDQLVKMGINTIHLMPVTTIGKIKALGTAGSLYAIKSFTEINPQLISEKSELLPEAQLKFFVAECHKRNLHVIFEVPAYGSYDLYLEQPDLFLNDGSNPIIPSDLTDVRVFNVGENGKINPDVYNLYKDYMDMILRVGADGIIASTASSKPADFWKELIEYTKSKNSQFIFIADSKTTEKQLNSFNKPTPYDKLLEIGFDSYYGDYREFKNYKLGSELIDSVKFNNNLFTKYNSKKSLIGSFSTHNEISPILINGEQYSIMIAWLNATLPLNSYFVDGFATGDTYLYPWSNKHATKTDTDDDIYFVHAGKFDIFNFSAKPFGGNEKILQEFILANNFKTLINTSLKNIKFIPLNSKNPSTFAFARTGENIAVIVIGNLDFQHSEETRVNIAKLTKKNTAINVKTPTKLPVVGKGYLNSVLAPGEIQVMVFKNFILK